MCFHRVRPRWKRIFPAGLLLSSFLFQCEASTDEQSPPESQSNKTTADWSERSKCERSESETTTYPSAQKTASYLHTRENY